MKKYFFAAFAVFALLMSSCESNDPVVEESTSITVGFEDVTLTDGAFYTSSFTSGDLTFYNEYNADWESWSGFAASSLVDVTTAGWNNDKSVIAGAAYEGTQFGVAYEASFLPAIISEGGAKEFESLMICNSTYAYISMRDGDDYAKKFEDGDWFMVTIKGMTLDSIATGSTEFYLADFRDGSSTLVNTWEYVDLSPLGKCSMIQFSFTSSDNCDWGINTPTYVCIDNIVYAGEEEEE